MDLIPWYYRYLEYKVESKVDYLAPWALEQRRFDDDAESR
jgi:hypothetical protein